MSSADQFRVVRSDSQDVERAQLNKILRRLASSTITSANTLTDAADDAAAATAGVPVGSLYRTGTILKVRIT